MRKTLFLLCGMLILLFATPALAATYEVTVNTCDPPNMDTHASRTIGRGIYFNVTANGDYTIHVFLCDATSDHNLIAHETRMVSTSDEVMVFGKSTITWNESYFLFVGIEIDGTYTAANTAFISSDGSVIPGAFTGDGINVGDDFDLGSAKADDYVGCYLFFEPGFYDSGSTIGPQTPAEWGQAVRDWGEDIGVPYFYFIIAIIIAAICVAIPFGLAVQFDLDLPNFVYVVFIMVGVSVDWYVGLLDLWMFAMVVLFAALATISIYRETIEKFIPFKGLHAAQLAPLGKAVVKTSGKTTGTIYKDYRERLKAFRLGIKLPSYRPATGTLAYSPERLAAYHHKHKKGGR